MDVSFKDEIRELAKLPGITKEDQSIEKGKQNAKFDLIDIKNEIRNKVKLSDYKKVNDKCIVRFDYEVCFSHVFVWMNSAYGDGLDRKGIACEIMDEIALEAYKKELKYLAKEDDIKIELMYKLNEDDGRRLYFDIPGDYSWLNTRSTMNVVRRASCVLKCSFEF